MILPVVWSGFSVKDAVDTSTVCWVGCAARSRDAVQHKSAAAAVALTASNSVSRRALGVLKTEHGFHLVSGLSENSSGYFLNEQSSCFAATSSKKKKNIRISLSILEKRLLLIHLFLNHAVCPGAVLIGTLWEGKKSLCGTGYFRIVHTFSGHCRLLHGTLLHLFAFVPLWGLIW